MYTEKIILVIFGVAVLPYLGLPGWLDNLLILTLIVLLLFFLYRLVQEHNIVFTVPTDDSSDFLNQHNVMDKHTEATEETDN